MKYVSLCKLWMHACLTLKNYLHFAWALLLDSRKNEHRLWSAILKKTEPHSTSESTLGTFKPSKILPQAIYFLYSWDTLITHRENSNITGDNGHKLQVIFYFTHSLFIIQISLLSSEIRFDESWSIIGRQFELNHSIGRTQNRCIGL